MERKPQGHSWRRCQAAAVPAAGMWYGHKHIYNELELSVGSGFPSLPEHSHTTCLFTCFSSPSFLLFSPLGALFFSLTLPINASALLRDYRSSKQEALATPNHQGSRCFDFMTPSGAACGTRKSLSTTGGC